MSLPRNGNDTTQACAACKYQRKKCSPDCILAPFFPHYRPTQFLNAHKLFVSNITKIIKTVSPSCKEEAMWTIIFQSDVPAHDLVGGCFRIILDLQRQIECSQAELNIVLHQLALCRAQTQNNHPPLHISDPMSTEPLNAYSSCSMQHQYLLPHQEQQYLQEDAGLWAINDSLSTSSSFQVKNVSDTELDDVKLWERTSLKFDFDQLVDQSRDAGG